MELVFDDFPWVVRGELPTLTRWRDDAVETILREYSQWEAPAGQYNFPIASEDAFFQRLYDEFFIECLSYFEPFTIHPTNKRQSWAYVQNDAHASPVWHDHLLTATINGVYYLAVPDPSGELWFRHRDTVRKITPEEGQLYLFPRWLLHKPTAQTSHEYRISVNVELITNECPIARDGHWRW
jgi:hypothetical protein